MLIAMNYVILNAIDLYDSKYAMWCIHGTMELKGIRGKYNGMPFVVGIRSIVVISLSKY